MQNPLADIDEFTPLVLADGTVIDPDTGKKQRSTQYYEVPSNTEAQKVVAETRRKLTDLPEVPARMNVVSAVLSYHLFGLEQGEIAIALNMPVERIISIKMLESFTEMHDAVMANMIKQDKGEVVTILERAAVGSAHKMTELMHEADDERVQLSAAKDILDRNGHRPADVLEIRHKMSNSLKIEHIIRSDDERAPIIDLGTEDFRDGDSSE